VAAGAGLDRTALGRELPGDGIFSQGGAQTKGQPSWRRFFQRSTPKVLAGAGRVPLVRRVGGGPGGGGVRGFSGDWATVFWAVKFNEDSGGGGPWLVGGPRPVARGLLRGPCGSTNGGLPGLRVPRGQGLATQGFRAPAIRTVQVGMLARARFRGHPLPRGRDRRVFLRDHFLGSGLLLQWKGVGVDRPTGFRRAGESRSSGRGFRNFHRWCYGRGPARDCGVQGPSGSNRRREKGAPKKGGRRGAGREGRRRGTGLFDGP